MLLGIGSLLSACAGCAGSSSGGGADAALPDLPMPGPDAGADLSQPSDVTGSAVDIYVTDSGEVTRPLDLSGASLAALSLQGGAFVAIAGTGRADGSFTIPKVPAGTYYLKLGSDYIVTSARTLDLSTVFLGRPDRVLETKATNLSFTLDGLSPWQSGDDLEFFTPNNGAYLYSIATFAQTGPDAGATKVAGLSFEYSAPGYPPVLTDKAKGDRTMLIQLTAKTAAGGQSYQALVRSALLDPYSMVDGQTANFTATLAEPAQKGMVRLNWKRSEFAALGAAVNPGAQISSTYGGHSINVSAHPGAHAHGDFAGTAVPDLLVIEGGTGSTDADLGMLSFGNPFPQGHTVIGLAFTVFDVSYQSGTAQPLAMPAEISYFAEAAAFSADPVRPILGPPQQPLINGKGAFQDRSGVTLHPTLSWSPPATGSVDGYLVFVVRLLAQTGRTDIQDVATLHATDTQITVPDGILLSGESYFFKVRAMTRKGVDLSRQPYRHGLPEANADLLTGIMTP